MTAINEADELVPAVPGTSLNVDFAALAGLRASYRWLAYTRGLDGEQVSSELYGTDRSDELDELYAHAFAWRDTLEREVSR